MSDYATPEVRDLARRSADEIRRRGWVQHVFGDSEDEANCRVCLLGAISAAGRGTPFTGLTAPGADLVQELYARLLSGVTAWNDRPGRTVEEVLDLLDAVASGG